MSFFDANAATWDEDPSKVERASLLARKILTFGEGKGWKKALEFGCGTGLVSSFLRNELEEITLADSSPGMIEVLQKKIEREGIQNFRPLLLQKNEQLPDRQFELIYSLMAMHHVEDLDDTFGHFHRALKKGGTLAIADLVTESGDFHNAKEGMHVHHGFDRKILEKQLRRLRFETIDYQIFYRMTRQKNGSSSSVEEYPLFLLIAHSF